ncbi:MAG: hypothetical protein Ct9H300mP28_14850 [Pseudomonadota bacterium]|nr:MAG: hypothetical protein Ct9H300mP28_14850 [Pseudomonadota bacterium]
MLEFGLQPDNIAAVHLGIASHNVFDLAYTHLLAEERGITEGLVFEMLEGMGETMFAGPCSQKKTICCFTLR